MKRTTIFADEDLLLEMRRISEEDNRPFAEVVREAMIEYIHLRNKKRQANKLSFIGIGKSSTNDIAERHEELLWRKDSGRRK